MYGGIILFGLGNELKKYFSKITWGDVLAVTDNKIDSKNDLIDKIKKKNSAIKIIKANEINEMEYDTIVIATSYKPAVSIFNQLFSEIKGKDKRIISIKTWMNEINYEALSLLNKCKEFHIEDLTDDEYYFFRKGVLNPSNVFGYNIKGIHWSKEPSSSLIISDLKFNEFMMASDEFDGRLYVFHRYIVMMNDLDYLDIGKVRKHFEVVEIKALDIHAYLLILKESMTIYTVTHRPMLAINDPIYKTLWAGDKSECKMDALVEDGDTISELNGKINECTALYWIWKNRDEDIIGLNHYRRFFKLDEAKENILTQEDIRNLLDSYDLVLARKSIHYPISNEKIIEKSLDSKAYIEGKNIITDCIKKAQAGYINEFRLMMEGYVFYPCQMFIGRKELVNQYCEWLFSIVIPAAKVFNNEAYDSYSKRTIGFFAERLLTVWLMKQNYRIKECPIIFLDRSSI